MNTVFKGIVAGLVATVVLSVLMVMKNMMGMLPEMDIIKMLAGMMGGAAIIGWAMHFMVGAGYGAAFSLFHNSLPGGDAIGKGITLGVIGWLVMMVMLMPMMGAGFFGLSFGMMAPVATLMLHVIFGAVLGGSYKALVGHGGHLRHAA
ncbi:DUF6789 family protein [Thiothrix subterranea]|uniref:Uncharacterized protein n=1 Tax=Thiothrix subterranea TaxID=2735563 RepID=A0AA51QVK5_9GAMM|nr:DUF6789 family protein [Thiothrix subterranea]MDQ5768681.1 hypothetical protein [Thiothrix subterranea]WML84833.1 hypothetical protein RCG00_00690 [Thiothrix subterranea]